MLSQIRHAGTVTSSMAVVSDGSHQKDVEVMGSGHTLSSRFVRHRLLLCPFL